MRSIQGHLQQFKRQYFQYRYIDKYSKQETIRRFDEDIFPEVDRGSACKNKFRSAITNLYYVRPLADKLSNLSAKNWKTAVEQWESEWSIGSGGPREEAWTEMSGLGLWYEGDRAVLHLIPAVPLYQPEYAAQLCSPCHVADYTRPDKVRFWRSQDAQSAGTIQAYAFNSTFLDHM